MGSLATLVPDRERARVTARAAQLCRDLGPGDWPGPAQPELSRRVCLAVTAIAPTLPDRRLALLARYAGWSVRLDDRLDRPEADPDALHRLRDAVAAVTAGRPIRDRSVAADPVPDRLVGILAELAGLDRTGGAAVARFGAALRDAVDGGVEHALLGRLVAAGTRPPPTAEQYLAVAAGTVNYRSFGYALLALTGVDDLDRVVDRALRSGSGAVRLANDLRSRERDRAEQTLNVLRLRTAAGAPVTGAWVRAGIERRQRAHDRELAGAPAPAGVLIRCLRVSVTVGVLSVVLSLLVGVPLGLLAGFYRLLDPVISRLTDTLLAFPFLVIAVGLAAILGPSLTTATVALGIGGVPLIIRVARSETLRLRELDFVAAAVADGAGDAQLLGRHILPNAVNALLVQATVSVPMAIIGEAILSFLGLGVRPPTPSLGVMISSAQPLFRDGPWLAVIPGVAIVVLTLALNLFGDGLRDALDPRERR